MIQKITSVQHPIVKHIVKLRQNRDYRYDHNSLVIEGVKLISEISQDQRYKAVFALDESLLPKGIKSDEIFIVTESILHKISTLTTPEGIVAEISMPQPASLKGLNKIIILDGVGDPGNFGAILRSAIALGWDGVFILENSCDPFNDKAMRAARGATFRLPLAWGNWVELKKLIKANKLEPLVADLDGVNLADVKVDKKIALVLGNESLGVSEEAKSICKSVTIPMPGKMESLNVSVAGGILMYALGTSGKK